MCHWVLRIWKCGESGFTKYSSCNFDRAADDPTNLLNPLHHSVTPSKMDDGPQQTAFVKRSRAGNKSRKTKAVQKNKYSIKLQPKTATGSPITVESGCAFPTDLSRSIQPTAVSSTPPRMHAAVATNGTETTYPRDAKTGETIPIPLSEIGKASRFGDKTLGESSKCSVFEVVLQTKEASVCPACARSPRRALLPAHARGYFGLS